jgi:hypothetical protein
MIDNFDQLVLRCERARQRRILRLAFMIVGTILFVVSGVAGYQMWLESKSAVSPIESTAVVSEKITPIPSVSVKKSPDAPKTSVPTADKKTAKTDTPSKNKTEPTTSQSAPSTPSTVAPIKPDTATATASSTAPTTKSNRLFEVNTQSADTPLEAYQNNPKYETALAVARDYYTKQNFADAAIWAKKANQMNREAEDAWLLYAKSYYAQGRKSEAIGVLELYLNYKDSKAASELLRTWKLNSTN